MDKITLVNRAVQNRGKSLFGETHVRAYGLPLVYIATSSGV